MGFVVIREDDWLMVPPAKEARILLGKYSLVLSQSGIAIMNDLRPTGAKLTYVFQEALKF